MYSLIKRHRLSILTLIGLTIVATGFLTYGQKTKTAKIKTAKVEKGSITETITASGKVDAATKASLRFQTSGRLAWVGVAEGDQVKKGQAIASLDKQELEKNLRKELNDYLKERWDFEQEREDYNIKIDPKKELITDAVRRIVEKSQFDLNNAVIDVEIKDLALRFATLVSPIAGIVVHLDQPHAGVNITPATAEFVIVDPLSTEFVAEVDEVDIGRISEGQKAKITLDAYPEEKFASSVRQVNFVSTTTKGGSIAYLAKIDLPANENHRLKVGMNGEAEIFLADKQETLLVPQKAITSKDGKTAIWIVDADGKASLKQIKLGAETVEKAEVIEGVKEGEKIAVESLEELVEGETIN